ncbi:endonuclease/exonuclease/phosphatase family protein [Streptomyces zaomyceticus]
MAISELPNSRTEADGSAVLRVLSYNVRSMRDDEDALARVIRACAPDIVFVQEAPRFFRWRKHAARLAAKSELLVLSGGATAAGPLLLCSLRATVERTEDVLLPLTPGLHRRGLATAVVRFAGARVGLVSCHLSLRKEERYAQAGMVLDRVAALGTPYTLVAGDLNERPEGPAFRRLAKELRDGWEVSPWGGENTSTPRGGGGVGANHETEQLAHTRGVGVGGGGGGERARRRAGGGPSTGGGGRGPPGGGPPPPPPRPPPPPPPPRSWRPRASSSSAAGCPRTSIPRICGPPPITSRCSRRSASPRRRTVQTTAPRPGSSKPSSSSSSCFMRPTSVAKPPRKPPTQSVVSHQVMSHRSRTATSMRTGPPTTASQANLVVASVSGSGGGSGGTKWPSSEPPGESSSGSAGE